MRTGLSGSGASRWREDGMLALLLDAEGGWQGRLEVTEWYDDQMRDPQIAWVVSWPVPGGGPPYIYRACIEAPALVADNEQRRTDLAAMARASIATPPAQTQPPYSTPARSPVTPEEWRRHLHRQISVWVDASDELRIALDARPGSNFDRYRLLVETLGWAYALDGSIQALWESLGEDVQEAQSAVTDARAEDAAAHNAALLGVESELADGPLYAAYNARKQHGRPYGRWPDLMLAGIFQREFFRGLSWVRGHLVHQPVDLPIELHQHAPGEEPRWKWSRRESFAREIADGRKFEVSAAMYDKHFSGHDVVGLFSDLVGVFSDAERRLVGALADGSSEAAGG
jgi:hypothetical protein